MHRTETLSGLGSNNWGVALSPDDHWLAVVHAAGKVHIWDWTQRRRVASFEVPFEWTGRLHFSRSGRFLWALVTFNDWTTRFRVWRTGDWQEMPLGAVDVGGFFWADFAPDDRLLAGGYDNGAVRLWSFPTGVPQAMFTNHSDRVNRVLFSPDGRTLFSNLAESLARQEAMTELLNAVSTARTDLTPVFDTLAHQADRLCGGTGALVAMRQGDGLVVVAGAGGLAARLRDLEVMPIDDSTVYGASAKHREIVHIRTWDNEPADRYTNAPSRRAGAKSALTIPMVRDDVALGVVAFSRFVPGWYTEAEVALLKTFVEQAAVAVDNARLLIEIEKRNSELAGSLDPIAHENDVWRALTVALQLIRPPADFEFLAFTPIGLSSGTRRTGAYGGSTRRTYGVLGDQVNMAARLMEHAKPGQVLVSDRVRKLAGVAFEWQALGAVKAKGKSEPIPVHALLGAAQRATPRLLEPQYALPMVGRKQELDVIQAKLTAALANRGQVLSIVAEAGMGKSRLVAEAIRMADRLGL